jgi:type VI protein secretion system component VasK
VEVSFIGGRNRSTRRKSDVPQITDKLYHIYCIKYTSLWTRFDLTSLVVRDTNCICSVISTLLLLNNKICIGR